MRIGRLSSWLLALTILGVIVLFSTQSYILKRFLQPIIRPLIQTEYSTGLAWINPLNGRITLTQVRVFAPKDRTSQVKSGGVFQRRPILASIKKIVLDLDLAPLARGQLYLSRVIFTKPQIFWLTGEQGQDLTLEHLVKLLSPPPDSNQTLPNFAIKKLTVDDLKLVGRPNQVPHRGFSVEINDLTSRAKPSDWPTEIIIRQKQKDNQSFDLQARANLFLPAAKMKGIFKVDFQLENSPYLWDPFLALPLSGSLQLAGQFSLTDRPNLEIDFKAQNISLTKEETNIVSIPELTGRAELTFNHELVVKNWVAEKMSVLAKIGADGSFNLAEIFRPAPPPQPAAFPPLMTGIAISNGRIEEGAVKITREFSAEDQPELELVPVRGTINQTAASGPIRFILKGRMKNQSATLAFSGSLQLPAQGIYLDTHLEAARVPLELGPLFWGRGVLPSLNGCLDVSGNLKWHPDILSLRLNFKADDCRAGNAPGFKNSYILKTKLFSADLSLDLTRDLKLSLQQISLSQPTLVFEIDHDGKANLLEIFPARTEPVSVETAKSTGSFFLSIGKISIDDGDLVMIDEKFAGKKFVFRLTDIQGQLANLTNYRPRNTLDLDLRGGFQLSPDSTFALRGKFSPGAKLDFDLLLAVRKLRLITLEPYLTKEAVDFSRTVMNLASQIECRSNKLSGENFISLKQVKLTSQASSDMIFGLPARAVFNFLKNTQGRLELSFNTSGTLNKPEFDLARSLQAKIGERLSETTGDTGISIMSLPSTILSLPNFLLRETGKLMGVEGEEK